MHDICPELHQFSPPFHIEERTQDGDGLSVFAAPPASLGLFLSLTLPGATGGVVGFAGGPITALDWHPDGFHLAVSASRITQPVHRLLTTYLGAGHVQIWRAAESALSLVALVPHNGDTAWDLSWRPYNNTDTDTDTPRRVSVLAVAYASGQLSIYNYPEPESPFENDHQSIDLRHTNALADPVRSVQWNPSGTRLASGTARGCVEIWDVIDVSDAMPKVQLATRVRVHDFSVSKVVWLNDYEVMSSGHDGTVAVRDVRMPFESLDSINDGLAWNQCLVAAEPDVAIAGTDNGTLKLIKLPSQGPAEKAQVKRKRVQTGSLRDMVSTPVPPLLEGATPKLTALFSAGAEGTLFLGHFPRPLWNLTSGTPPKLNCNAGRYMQIPLLQWTSASQFVGDEDEGVPKNEDAITPLRKPPQDEIDGASGASSPRGINPATSREKFVVASRDLYSIRENPLVLRLVDTLWTKAMERMISRTAQKVRIHVRADVHLCGADYDQRTVIPRIAFSEKSRLLVAATHAGLITVQKITDTMLNYMRPDSCGVPRAPRRGPNGKKPATKTKNSAAGISKDGEPIPVKKRGRPRKYPQPEAVREARSVVEEVICNVLDEPFDDSLIIKPRRGGAPCIVVSASKRARKVRSIKMHLALKEQGLKGNIASRKRTMREEKKKQRTRKRRRRTIRVEEEEDGITMNVPLRLALKPEGLKKPDTSVGRTKKRPRAKTEADKEEEEALATDSISVELPVGVEETPAGEDKDSVSKVAEETGPDEMVGRTEKRKKRKTRKSATE